MSEDFIAFSCCESLPSVEDIRKIMRWKWFDHNVYVIRHHAPRMEMISLVFKVQKCLRNNSGNLRIFQKACLAIMRLKIQYSEMNILKFVEFPECKFPIRIFCSRKNVFSSFIQISHDKSREGTGEAEGDEIGSSFFAPMREIGAFGDGEC